MKITKSLLFFNFVLLIFNFQNSYAAECAYDKDFLTIEEDLGGDAKKPVILLVHGVNNNLSIFNDFKKNFKSYGFTIATLRLAGHSGHDKDFHCATKDRWLYELNQSVANIKKQYPQKSLVGLGYSLGGLLLVRAELTSSEQLFDKMILIAPALAVRSYTRAVDYLSAAVPWQASLPSQAPKEFLAYPRTSLLTYRALFDVLNEFENTDLSKARLPPGIIISHRDDLLVSTKGLKQVAKQKAFSGWVFYERKDAMIWPHYTYHHIFSKEAFSRAAWNAQMEKIIMVLDSGSPQIYH